MQMACQSDQSTSSFPVFKLVGQNESSILGGDPFWPIFLVADLCNLYRAIKMEKIEINLAIDIIVGKFVSVKSEHVNTYGFDAYENSTWSLPS